MVQWNTSGHDFSRHLSLLVGQSVKAGFVQRQKTWREADGFVGLFRTDEGALEASCHLDLPLAAGLGCALSLLSPHAAKEAVESANFSPELLENIHEIFNVIGGLKNGPGQPHVVLAGVFRVLEGADDAPLNWRDLPCEGFIQLNLNLHGSGAATLRATP